MRFLIDNALSPGLATLIAESGEHDTVHVRSIGLQHAEDVEIFERAAADDRILATFEPSRIRVRALPIASADRHE